MEKFREHEKEFKQNKLTKTALQNMSEIESKFMFSGEDSDSYGDLGGFDSSGASGDETKAEPAEPHVSDKEWLAKFLAENLKKLQTGVETELTDIKNKKKGRNSKNKEKISALLKKLESWKKIRDLA
jgi:hypothetical protein